VLHSNTKISYFSQLSLHEKIVAFERVSNNNLEEKQESKKKEFASLEKEISRNKEEMSKMETTLAKIQENCNLGLEIINVYSDKNMKSMEFNKTVR